VDSILAEHASELSTREIKLVKSVSGDVPSMTGDEDLLSKALDGLIGHCILSTPAGNPLFVTLQREQDWILIVFRHHAEGISEEDLEQFFLPRLPFKESSKVLDLPLSRIIVNKHGGRIDDFREEGDMIMVKVVLPDTPGIPCSWDTVPGRPAHSPGGRFACSDTQYSRPSCSPSLREVMFNYM